MGYADDNSLKEELETCKHFLVDSKMENGRDNFAMDTLEPKHLLKKLDVAFKFVLENAGDGSFRYYYTHETKTIVEISELVATTEDLTKLKNLLSKTDVLEQCTR